MLSRAVTDSPSDATASLGQRIRLARNQCNLSQEVVAKHIGVSRAALGQWESDTTPPPVRMVEAMAELYKVEPQWLAFAIDGSVRKVYQSNPADNVVFLTAYTISGRELAHLERWGIPRSYLTYDLHSDPEETFLVTIDSPHLEPQYARGDVVFVDGADMSPSPSGTFLYDDGYSLTFALIQLVPSAEKPVVRIIQAGTPPVEVPLNDIVIKGRVIARFHRS